MDLRIQIISVLASGALLGVIFELLRRKRLMERYALLWLLSGIVLLGLAVWRDLLEGVAEAIGIYYAPSALFVIAFGFILVLLLHFSMAVSKLADQNKVLAQKVGLLEQQLRERTEGFADSPAPDDEVAPEPEPDPARAVIAR